MDNVISCAACTVCEWREAGWAVVLEHHPRTWGSAPRPVVAWWRCAPMACYWFGLGGCIEDDLVEQLRAGALSSAPHAAALRRGRRRGPPLWSFCGGTLELMLEPLGPQSQLDEVLAPGARRARAPRLDSHGRRNNSLRPKPVTPSASTSSASSATTGRSGLLTSSAPAPSATTWPAWRRRWTTA